jgi:hypothetical protein
MSPSNIIEYKLKPVFSLVFCHCDLKMWGNICDVTGVWCLWKKHLKIVIMWKEEKFNSTAFSNCSYNEMFSEFYNM